MLEVLFGYYLGRSFLKKELIKVQKTQETESKIMVESDYSSFSQDDRSLEQVLALAKENARAKQNSK